MISKIEDTMPRDLPSGIKVLVVGAGLGGLFAAGELYRKGHDVEIIEAGPDADGLGDFVGIGPSATRQFRKWPGMVDIYLDICYRPALTLYKYDGEVLGGPFPAIKNLDSPTPTPVSRSKLLRALRDYVDSLGIPITYKQRVTRYYENVERRQAGVVTESGKHYNANLVVAADGVGSKSGAIITGAQIIPKSSGFAVYRVAFPTEIAFEDPKIAKEFALAPGEDDHLRMYLGKESHAIILVAKDITTWLLTHRDDSGATESWSNTLDAQEVIHRLKNGNVPWDPIILEVLKQVPKRSIVDWKLLWRNPQPQWASPNGLVVQLGDAAHSFLPTSANGATQAMEDGISLAACLAKGGKDDIALAIKVHNTLRFQRVSCAQRTGFKNREKWHHTDFEAAKKHPEQLAEMVGHWITSHDPEPYVYDNWSSCVDHITAGKPFVNTNIPPGYTYEPWTIEELLQASEEGITTVDAGNWA